MDAFARPPRPEGDRRPGPMFYAMAFFFGLSVGCVVVGFAIRTVRHRAARTPTAEAARPHTPTAADSIPELAQSLTDKDAGIRWEAAKQLKTRSPDDPVAVRAWIDALRDPDPVVRATSASALAASSVETAAVQAGLRSVFNDANAAVRGAALDAFWRVAGTSPVCATVDEPLSDAYRAPWRSEDVPALTRILEDPYGASRLKAAAALAAIGREAREAVPALIERLDDPETDVVVAAARALAEIGPAAREAIPALFDAMHRDIAVVRAAGQRSLDAIGDIPAGLLIDELKRNDARHRGWAREQLLKSNETPRLVEALRDPSPVVREAAARALSGAAPAEAAGALVRAVGDPDAQVRTTARESLTRMRNLPPAILIDAVKTGDRALSDWAARALSTADDSIVPALIEATKDRKSRRAAVELLMGRGGPAAQAAVPAVRAELADAEGDGFWAAGILAAAGDKGAAIAFYVGQFKGGGGTRPAQAAGELRTLGSAAVPALEKLLDDGDAKLRQRTVDVLGEIGGAEVVPALTKALRDDDTAARQAAARALGRIGPSATDAAPALYRALNDPEFQVREAATDALKRIQTR